MKYSFVVTIAWCIVTLLVLGVKPTDATSPLFDHQGRLVCDDIVIGAGPAGCPLTESLSRNPDNVVCLFEAGVDNYDAFKYEAVIADQRSVPKYGHGLRTQKSTEPEIPYLSSLLQVPPRDVTWGRAFGGGLAYAAGTFHRPSPWDFERWNATGWTFEELAEDWRELETYHNAYLPTVDPAVHGTSGPVHVSVFELQPSDWRIANATMDYFNIPFQVDPAGNENPSGLHSTPRPAWRANPTDARLTRQDMCSTFLSSEVLVARPNLIVLLNTEVTKIEFKTTANGKIKAKSVEYYSDGRTQKAAVVRGGDVFITAGVVNTPALLMRSGVGNCVRLAELDIECVLDQPQVGRNMHFNMQKGISYVAPSILVPPPSANDPSDGAIVAAYVRSAFASPMDTFPDGEITFTGVYEPQFGIWTYLFAAFTHEPNEPGYVDIVSTNPFEHPLIVTNLLRNAQEALPLADLLLKIRAIMSTVQCPVGPNITIPCFTETGNTLLMPNNVGQVAQWLVANGVPAHKFGTCSIGAVVDAQDLRVTGIENVRVCDNSAAPVNPRTHSNSATAAIIGKRCGTLVLEERGWNF